ncbi:hypothetical protein MY11210_002452 [Beauveria gryllotalpidicola]
MRIHGSPHGASSTVDYVAAAPRDCCSAREERHGRKPDIFRQSTEPVTAEFLARLDSDLPAIAPAWYWRKLWGTGDLTRLLGSDIWHVPSVRKATLDDLIVTGEVDTYRDLSQILPILEEAMFK